jgi:hypothetical protein
MNSAGAGNAGDSLESLFTEEQWRVLGLPEFAPRDLKLQPCFDFGQEASKIPELGAAELNQVAAAFRHNVVRVKMMLLVPHWWGSCQPGSCI